jgi:hypothetical protein
MRRIFIAVLACTCLLPAVTVSANHFATEAEAARHCPHDTVVWLNLPTMVWHLKGQRWYGHTNHGAYSCEKEAAAEGARETRNGQ